MIDTRRMSRTDLVNEVLRRIGTAPSKIAHKGYTPDFPSGRNCEVLCREAGGHRVLQVAYSFNSGDKAVNRGLANSAMAKLSSRLGAGIVLIPKDVNRYVGFELPVPRAARDGYFDCIADLAELLRDAIDPDTL